MPMKKEKNNGTNTDGSKNLMYCSHCYQQGEFTAKHIHSAAEMQAHVKEKLKTIGLPGFIAGWFTKNIPNLKRWNP